MPSSSGEEEFGAELANLLTTQAHRIRLRDQLQARWEELRLQAQAAEEAMVVVTERMKTECFDPCDHTTGNPADPYQHAIQWREREFHIHLDYYCDVCRLTFSEDAAQTVMNNLRALQDQWDLSQKEAARADV